MVARGFAVANREEPNLVGVGSELMKNWRPLLSSNTLAIWALAGREHKISVTKHMQAGMAMRRRIGVPGGRPENSADADRPIQVSQKTSRTVQNLAVSRFRHISRAAEL